MADETKIDLWPDNIAPATVRTPISILRQQAELVRTKTNERLEARIDQATTDGATTLSFMMVAPTIRYSVRLFHCLHDENLVYPITIFAEAFYPSAKQLAMTEDSFMKLLATVLGSSTTRSMFQALLSRVDEKRLKDV